MYASLTCDPEAVRSAGVRKDIWRRLVVLEQTVPLCHVVASKEIECFCWRNTGYSFIIFIYTTYLEVRVFPLYYDFNLQNRLFL